MTRTFWAAIAVLVVGCASQTGSDTGIPIGGNDIGGVVSGPSGPEAGVWVIAETVELPTKYTKIVVTEDRGRYVLPALPTPGTTSGCGATAWSIRPRFAPSPASISISLR